MNILESKIIECAKKDYSVSKAFIAGMAAMFGATTGTNVNIWDSIKLYKSERRKYLKSVKK